MCGIAGIVGRESGEHRDAVVRMLAAMEHRGPDGSGVWCSPSGQCILGHRRLSILDLSEAADQPMTARNERFVLTYNGECYNYRELRKELEGQGATFRSSGDTEVVLEALTRSGAAVLERFNAMFAIALWDEQEKHLLLARDRFGQKPLYWVPYRDGLLFASEVRALLASGLVERRFSMSGVLSFFCYGAVQGPDTIVAGVRLLPRATSLSFRIDQSPRQAVYWKPSKEQRPVGAMELQDAFVDAVKRHLISDVPIGMFLSGGVDSSIITASACRVAKGAVKSLSVVFPDQPQQSEGEHARRIAHLTGADHTEIPFTGTDMLSMLDQALERMDQPTIDAINTYIVSRAARQAGLTVALSGVGGDELFGGYASFKDVFRGLNFRRRIGPICPLLFLSLKRTKPISSFWSKLLDIVEAPPRFVPLYLIRRKLICSRLLHALVPGIEKKGWLSGLDAEREAELNSLIEGRSPSDSVAQLELEAYMGQVLLRDADVMGMACGLEIRAPFLDANFADLALAQPPEARLPRQNVRKWPLIDAFRDIIPQANWLRAKQGFGLPFEHWLRQELRERIEDELVSFSGASDIFDRQVACKLWNRFQAAPASIGWSRIWALFVLCHYIRHQKLSKG